MADDGPRTPQELSADERQRLHHAHQRLRNASSALEALVATEPIKGRWPAAPAPFEALQVARDDVRKAYQALERSHVELLGWDPEPVS
ncbi:MAG: hypothetical protein QOD63_856 [Actinomycetota bacterium]|jgi:DNA-binding SARP family transcriptional activator|nr:hypothetical protein [Actinomycetota bacterium]